MEYAVLGKTGKLVSRMGYGGAAAGLKNYLQPFDPSDENDRRMIYESIREALAIGINYFDTAPAYGKGQSETLLGEALDGVKACGGERPQPLFLATKVAYHQRGALRETVESSLERLRVDRFDLLQIHGDSITSEQADEILRTGGMAEEMHRLKEEGLFDYVGFTSEDNNDSVYRFIRSGMFDTMQICYNFIFQHAYEPSRPFGSLYEAEKANMGIVTMRTPTSGTFQRWIQMVNPQNTFDYTPALIQFVLSNPLVDVALLGMRSADIVRKNEAIMNDATGRINIEDVHARYV